MQKLIIQMAPVGCPSCIKKIEGALKKVDGLANTKVLFNTSKVKADIDTSIVTAEEVVNIIEKLGFDVEKVKVK